MGGVLYLISALGKGRGRERGPLVIAMNRKFSFGFPGK
jgi:hypothetical protein